MSIGIFLVMIQTYVQLRFKFRNINDLRFNEPQDMQELRHEITVWQRAAASLSSYSKDEDLVRETLVKKVNRLQRQLKKKLSSGSVPKESYQQTLQDLQLKVSNADHLNLNSKCHAIISYFFNLFILPVSHSELGSIDKIGCRFGVRDKLLLLAFAARYSKTIVGMDSSAWCHFIVDTLGSFGHGSNFSSR